MRQKSLLRLIAEPLIVAVVLAFAVRSCVGIYAVPSSSMTPALQPGDRIVVIRTGGQHVERGDVIVFHSPEPGGALSVKRVIGLPGDLVEARHGRVLVRGRILTEPFGAHRGVPDIPPQLVPGNYLFVMGDNRAESWDSRQWGPLPAHLVVGRARMILWQGGAGGRTFKWIE